MSIGSLGNGQPSQEELMEMQEQREKEREDRQTAQSLASQAASQKGAAEPGYWRVIGDPDISREFEDDGLDEFAATEFANPYALGNIDKSDWESLSWRIETEFWTMRNEFQDKEGKMGDDDLRIMYGEERPSLDNEKARRLRTASEVKKLYSSLSIGARGLRSGTEIHAVAKTENDEPDEEKGRINRLKSALV